MIQVTEAAQFALTNTLLHNYSLLPSLHVAHALQLNIQRSPPTTMIIEEITKDNVDVTGDSGLLDNSHEELSPDTVTFEADHLPDHAALVSLDLGFVLEESSSAAPHSSDTFPM